MTEHLDIMDKIKSLTLKTYGIIKNPTHKDYMTKEEVIAMSPLGSSQPTAISKRYAKNRASLPPALKKALNYLYPAKIHYEKPPVSKYDSMVRKMSNYSLALNNDKNNVKPEKLKKKLSKKLMKKLSSKPTLMRKMSGIFDFKKPKEENPFALIPKRKSRSVIKLPPISSQSQHNRYSSLDFISCINYTGEAESEYLKTYKGQEEYKKLYELSLLDSGLYSEIRIRNQNRNRIHYKRMPA
ncbi:hypothetical protein SteCoe_31326 [Stentor coeruleus]|uniref:Uncharacterized protein n=1 Tax=Stentor coeruleus TaxID=5963 RepID=A0A1R2B1M9_9CILI|nr:hypothetical protein SteCoe_31326 [Stentor coeruleus]